MGVQLHPQKLFKGVVYRNQYNFGLPKNFEGASEKFRGAMGSLLQLISSPAFIVTIHVLYSFFFQEGMPPGIQK